MGSGILPVSMVRKLAARLRRGFGAMSGLPRRMRSQAATRVGICAVSRRALRREASRELSAGSGSKAESADTPVRSTSIGVVRRGSSRSMSMSLAGSRRVAVAASALVWASSSFRVGSAPCHKR